MKKKHTKSEHNPGPDEEEVAPEQLEEQEGEQQQQQEQEQNESKPSGPGTYYGELSPLRQWFWSGTGTPQDQWIANPAQETGPPVVMPQAASASFYLTINCTYPPGATQIAQASTYQLVTPWGQSTACIDIDDAFNQAFGSASSSSGQMWNYLNNGVTRGLTTTSATVPVSASYFQALP